MDIVKQRRKRLMAWILAIGLCVGLWQGSAYAGEVLEEGSSVSGNNVAEEGVLLAEDTRTTSFPISYKDNDNGTQETLTKQYMINSTGESKDLTNGISISISSTADSITLTGKSEKDGKEYTHSLISWNVSASGGASEIEGTGNTISFSNFIPDSSSNTMTVVWQKLLVADMDGTETIYQQESEDETFATFEFKSVENMSSTEIFSAENGKFFSEWTVEGQGIGEENTSVDVNYGTFIEKKTIGKLYNSSVVPVTGTYNLTGSEYILGNSSETWNVGSDGYNYTGGITFVGPGVEYTYTKN